MKQASRVNIRSLDHELEWIECGPLKMLLKKCPTNGNCLFEAIKDQIYKLGIPVARYWSQLELRERIADHILAFLPNYSQQIISNIQEMNDDYEFTIRNNEIQNYVEQIKENHFWGGAESIKAASEILNARITVFLTNGKRIPFGPRNNRYTMKLLYRQVGPKTKTGCNHYDSIRSIRNSLSAIEQQNILNPGQSTNSVINTLSTSPLKQSLYPTSSLYPSDRILKSMEHQPRKQFAMTTKLKIGTWNIRGCIKESKKDDLCQTLNNENLDIACIQETHLSTGQQLSPNYTWFLSGGAEYKVNRGVAILVNAHKGINLVKFTPYSENIASCVIETGNQSINIITCHMPCDSAKEAKDNFHLLSRIIAEHSKTGIPTIVAGDFNAHIGYTDIQKETRGLIGKKIGHKESNKNGDYLKDIILLHNLNLSTSWSQSNSVLVTWSNGTSKSQLDHILCSNGAPNTKIWCKAKWIADINTDHKMVYAALVIKKGPKANPTPKKIHNWNIARLKIKEDKERYKNQIKTRLAKSAEQTFTTTEAHTKGDRWKQLCGIIKDSANETLNTPSSPMTPKRRKALADQQKARFRKNKFPKNPELTQGLKQANIIREIRHNEHEINKCSKFFRDISTYHPLQRTRLSYKFLKQFNRKASSKKKKYIPMTQWEKTLYNPENHLPIQPLKEIPTEQSLPPPSYDKIVDLVQNYKKGTAPGIDKINIELLQESTPELMEELTQIITQAWNLNIIPESWTHTIQLPIPKIPSPSSTDDYRRITLCSVAYKIYAKFLLEVLDENMTPIPQYQAAFLANRSTDDHIFTSRRLLEEAWKEGKVLYVMALDLAKAFDTVEHKALVTILKHRGVPIFLINRIITACIHEKTAIQWFGQTTKFYNKSKGVKQGCPISPRLFTIVLHEVISTTTETLGNFTIQDSNHLSIPTLLAYADDLLVIADNTNDLDLLLQEITPNLESTGLHLNLNKCEVMIRDPYNSDPTDIPKYLIINQTQIRVVQTLKYLGSFLTNHLNRRGTTRTRIEKALKSARMIIPFLQQHKPPWNMVRSIYNTMIVPVATYGLKATAMTSINRMALKNMEKLTLSLLAQHCRRTPSTKITTLLKGKTIWRKLMVQRIRYWGHILRRPNNNILQAASRVRPLKKKVGRPCDTWNTTLEKDITRSQIPKKIWLEKAKDKKELAKLTDDIYKIINSSDEEEITIL